MFCLHATEVQHLQQHAAEHSSELGKALSEELHKAEQQAESVRLAAMRITSKGSERLSKNLGRVSAATAR